MALSVPPIWVTTSPDLSSSASPLKVDSGSPAPKTAASKVARVPEPDLRFMT